MEFTGESPPFWPQLTSTTSFSRHHRRSPSPLLTPPVLIILLPSILLLLLFFAVPPFLSTVAAQISRPAGVKKSSDSLTILFVFFAILYWVFARRNDGDNDNSIDDRGSSNNDKLSPASPVPQRWFDQYAERKIYDDRPPINAAASAAEPTTILRRLKRSSTSYPDLRQDSLWENSDDRYRFFDDFEINKYRASSDNYIDQVHVHELRRSWRREQFEESEPNVTLPSKSPAPSTPPPPPPPPPPAAAYQKPRRTYQAVGQKEKVMSHVEFDRSDSPQPVTPPPPPSPPPRRPPSPLVQTGNRSEQRFAKLERRKSNAAKEIKMVFASLRKRKKKKAKDHTHDHHQHDCPLHSQSEPPPYYSATIPPPSPPPPPPPPMPPPPSSVFQKYKLFRSKGNKSKKIHSVPPAPPPPPPQVSVPKFMQNIQTPPTTPPTAPPTSPPGPPRRRTTPKSCRPPLPTKANTSIYYDENVNSGGQSPLIPNPPPPPPFKMPEFKFVFRGDFVNIRSSPSSRCSSPDLEEVSAPSSKYDDNDEKIRMMDCDDGAGVGGVPVICPSPDVNAKAETFIARFRDGWKLEKINSMKEKQRI